MYLNILENPPVILVSHNIIYSIWGQPNVDLYIEVTKGTFRYTNLLKSNIRVKMHVATWPQDRYPGEESTL